MFKERESVIRRAIILCDFFIISLSFLLALFLRQRFNILYNEDLFPLIKDAVNLSISTSEYLILFLLIVPFWCAMLYFNGMYRSMRTRKLLQIEGIVIKSTFFSVLFFGTIVFLFKLNIVSRLFFAIFILISFIFILAEKIIIFSIMHFFRKKGYNFRSLLIVGTGKRAFNFINKIKSHPEWGLQILGVVNDEPGRRIRSVNNIKVIGSLNDIAEILQSNAVDEVIFVVPRLRLNHMENAINICETMGVKATIAVDLFDMKIARANQTELDGVPLLTFETTVGREWQLFVKRGIDIVVSGIGIILLSPIFLIVAILIKSTSSGPVLFKQRRVSLNGREFILYKFRTMQEGAEKKLSEIEILNEMEGPIFKLKKDPRITRVGKILRKFSIDELPQLFNVLVGHMSLVGPRPPIPKEVAQYSYWQRRRLSMRPGITCLWQVKGRNKIGFEDWMKLDLEYLDSWSLWLDIKILAKTIPVVLFGIGAY